MSIFLLDKTILKISLYSQVQNGTSMTLMNFCLVSPSLSDLAWLHPTDVLSCCSWTQYHSKHTHKHTHTHALNPCHILDTVWGPWCCKGATWGPKSSVVVGWLYNLIAWIVSFFFFVVKFFVLLFFLGLILRHLRMPNIHQSWHNRKAPGQQRDWLMDNLWAQSSSFEY